MSRKVKWLMAVIAVIVVGWSGFWFAGSIAAKRAIAEVERRSAEQGDVLTCSNPSVSGYPFRIEVRCDEAEVSSARRGIEGVVSAIRSVALLYKPGHVITEADGPVTLTLPPQLPVAGAVTGNWESMRASINAGISGLKRASFDGQEIHLDVSEQGVGQSILDAVRLANMQLHVRPNPETAGHYDIAASTQDLQVSRRNKDLPPMQISISARADNVGEQLGYDPERLLADWIAAGGQMEVRSARFESLGFSADIQGPLSISPDGLISGQIQVALNGLEKMPELIAEVAPRYEANAQQIAGTLQNFGQANAESDAELTISLLIRNGVVSAGIIPVGRIPELF